jgi:hypothetical protein
MLPATTTGATTITLAPTAAVTTLAPTLTYTPPASSPAEIDLSHLASSPHDSITSPPPLPRTPPLEQTVLGSVGLRPCSTPPTSPLCKMDEHAPGGVVALPAAASSAAGAGGGVVDVQTVDPGLSASLTASSMGDSYGGIFADDDSLHGSGVVLSFTDSIMDFLKTSETCYSAEPPADEDSFRMWSSMDAGEF